MSSMVPSRGDRRLGHFDGERTVLPSETDYNSKPSRRAEVSEVTHLEPVELTELTDAELDLVAAGASLISISGNKVAVGANVNANVLGEQGNVNQNNEGR